MKYVTDSLHYQPQGRYLMERWGEVRTDSCDVDPMMVVASLAEKHGIEVI